jgi:hypothetical protein
MKTLAASLGTLALFGLGFLLYLHPVPAYAVVTTTVTVIGNAVPNSAGLSNTVVAFILPLIITGFFVVVMRGLKVEGAINTFIIKLGLFLGCIFGMLSETAAAPIAIPIALPIVAGVYLVTYLWKGV